MKTIRARVPVTGGVGFLVPRPYGRLFDMGCDVIRVEKLFTAGLA